MNTFLNWFINNKEWIFSGIGVFVIGVIWTLVRRKKKTETGDQIITHGNQSPGKVYGDYEVHDDDKK